MFKEKWTPDVDAYPYERPWQNQMCLKIGTARKGVFFLKKNSFIGEIIHSSRLIRLLFTIVLFYNVYYNTLGMIWLADLKTNVTNL
jgi:hypothetical protein